MRPKRTWRQRRRLTDPIEEHAAFDKTESRIALAGHPIHAMLITYPIALAFLTLFADGMFWWTGDAFWPRMAVWTAGIAFVMGVLAGITGTVELLMVPGIRIRAPSWTHFILACTLLSVMGVNWGYRLPDPQAAVLPFGLLTSALAVGMTTVTGWHGGKLVFDYQIGTQQDHGS